MKKIIVAVAFGWIFVLLTQNAEAYTYDGDFDPRHLLEWEWVPVQSFEEDGVYLMKAENPSKGASPKVVTFMVEVEIDNHFTTEKKLLFYIVENIDGTVEAFLLNEENHYVGRGLDVAGDTAETTEGQCDTFPTAEDLLITEIEI